MKLAWKYAFQANYSHDYPDQASRYFFLWSGSPCIVWFISLVSRLASLGTLWLIRFEFRFMLRFVLFDALFILRLAFGSFVHRAVYVRRGVLQVFAHLRGSGEAAQPERHARRRHCQRYLQRNIHWLSSPTAKIDGNIMAHCRQILLVGGR